MVHWYDNRDNLIELAEFLVESDELTTAKELLDYFKHPEKYTDVWETYQEEIIGKPHSSNPGTMCIYKIVPPLVALVQPSSQCENK